MIKEVQVDVMNYLKETEGPSCEINGRVKKNERRN